MKRTILFLITVFVISAFVSEAFADIKYQKGYSRKDGTYVSGHYKDTSGDGNPYNNANYLGYND